ncbi:MAG: cobyrinate a,c-diamide synthase [Thermodesulfovibrionales bacterium]
MRGFVIAGTHSGCGKTTITLGLMAALKKRGLKVQPFKAGPDFIDTGLHRLVTGGHSRNLDVWMCGEEYVKECFYKYSADADISIIEGVMGMYDGEYSTAKLAGLLNLPVILVVDAYGMAESAGAVVKGFREYGSELRVKSYELREMNSKFKIQSSKLQTPNSKLYIAGVIFNRVASENHFKRLKDSVQAGDSTLRDVMVLGYLPRDLDFEIPHRHLGLTVAEENPLTEKNIEKLAETVLKHVDIDEITHLKRLLSPSPPPPPIQGGGRLISSLSPCGRGLGRGVFSSSPPIKVAVAYDKAFCFYYEDNLDLLKDAGAEIVKFSPLSDSAIPDKADAIYIGGGYPELYAKELSKNTSMMKSINGWANSGKPIYAECGGLMYLSKGIYDFNGNFFEMAGVFSFETQIPPYPPLAKGGKGGLRPHLGYREIELKDNCILGKKGDKLKGHEFHYSEIIKDSNESIVTRNKLKDSNKLRVTSCELKNKKDSEDLSLVTCYSLLNSNQDEGYTFKNTLASYIHVHFGSNLNIARNFIDFIYKYPSP